MPSVNRYRLRGTPHRFSNKYYDDYLRELIRYLSINAPELTSRDPSDPVIQEQRSIANALHHTSVIADHIALESLPYNARLLESFRQHLKLIDYDLRMETPSVVEIVAKLSSSFNSDDNQIIVTRALAESEAQDDDSDSVYFEYTDNGDIVIDRTDRVNGSYLYDTVTDHYNDGDVTELTTFTKASGPDFTVDDVNSSVLVIYDEKNDTFGSYGISEFVNVDSVVLDRAYVFEGTTDLRWALKRVSDDLSDDLNITNTTIDLWEHSEPNNMFYVGHPDVMFDSVHLRLDINNLGAGFTGVWEYPETEIRRIAPSRVSVYDGGVGLEFELETLYGDTNNSGATVIVEHVPTGTTMECVSYYDGANKIHTIGNLGQTTASLATKDYRVGSYWLPVEDVNDRTENFNITGKVSFTLPQTVNNRWDKVTVNDQYGYWLRYRITSINTAHLEEDTANIIGNVATDLASAISLFEELVGNFNDHISRESRIHIVSDTDVMIYSEPTNWTELSDQVNDAKVQFNNHIENSQHYSFVDDLVLLADSVNEQSSVLGLLNTMVANFDTHLQSYPLSPRIHTVDITRDNQYILFSMTQGRRVSDNPLGSSNGLNSQMFQLKRNEYIDGTETIQVNEDGTWIQWSRVDSFINSRENDRHYMVMTDGDYRTFIKFGGISYEDGSGRYGRIPPVGVGNIRAFYRNGARENGNVGSDTVINMTAGMINVSSITNPRPAYGWVKREGADLSDFDIVMDKASQAIKTLDKCVTASDAETLSINWVDTDGSSPVARAFSLEEAYGHKTIGLWVVANGGSFLTNGQIDHLDDYFNGDEGVALANTQIFVSNYSIRNIQLNILILGTAIQSRVKQALLELIHPLKRNSSNTDYLWKPGERVYSSRIIKEIHKISDDIRSVEIVSGGDVQLGEEELPVIDLDNTTITIVP